jgi:hypothetical protein
MTDWLQSLGHEIVPVLAIVGGLLIAAIGIFVGSWRKVRQAEMDAALKQDMLNRGMSAEEIERVLKASSGTKSCSG